jgi:hypothetical protein
MFDLDVPPLQQASRLDIDLPGRLGDENTVAGYPVEARCLAVSKTVEALPLPPTASVLVVIRDGIARSAASAQPFAPGHYVLARHVRRIWLYSIACSDHVVERMIGGFSASSPLTQLPHSLRSHTYDPAAEAQGALTLRPARGQHHGTDARAQIDRGAIERRLHPDPLRHNLRRLADRCP